MGFNARSNDSNREKLYTPMGLKVSGTLKSGNYFGEGKKHAWFTLVEEKSDKTLLFKIFNVSDGDRKRLEDSKKLDVEFSITNRKLDGNYTLQLVADKIITVE